MKAKYHVAIVGAGICGLSTAETLAGSGLDILIIDENVHLGGQLLRKPAGSPNQFSRWEPDGMKLKGFDLVDRLLAPSRSVDIVTQAQVLGIFNDTRLLIHTKEERLVETTAEQILLATGARERFLPFPGWTLPGVMSLGAAQILMKSHGILPGHRTAIAGTSPLMTAIGSQILKNRGAISGFFEDNPFCKKLTVIPLIPHHRRKLIEGLFYMARLMINRIPMFHSRRIIEARGEPDLTSFVAVKTDARGRPIPGTEKEYQSDALAVGYGFVPNIELAVQAGCDVEYRPDKGGWVVSTFSRDLETSKQSIYAAGEVTGIAGSQKSHIQGRIAGYAMLKAREKLNVKTDTRLSKQLSRLYSLNDRQTGYATFLNELCRVSPAAYSRIPDQTLICRCENITMGTIKAAVQNGFHTVGSIKKSTRSGMGRCQGRICTPIIQEILTALTPKTPETFPATSSRAPVKPVAVRSFLDRSTEDESTPTRHKKERQ